jgi:uridine kinase
MPPPTIARAVEEVRACRAPSGAATRVVAIDGLGGSGKSSLAVLLSDVLGASVVQTDDFASWSNPADWWPDLIERVLEPLASGEPARYTPTNWSSGPDRREIVVEPGDLVLVEGVTASREAFRRYLAYAIWVETRREVRLRRGLERDGEGALPEWERWMAAEDAYVERERPAEHVDLVLPGDADLWS